MRVFVASLATETNTFSPLYVDRSAFESAFYCPPGTHPDTPTLCSAPFVAARRRAATDGLHADRGHRDLGRARRARVARGLREPARRDPRPARGRAARRHRALRPARRDGGARTTTIARATCWRGRARIAGDEAVIGAELDMHCHLSDRMVEAADVIVAFKEFPHTDFLERAEDLVDLCLRAARGEVKPVAAVFDCRAIAAFMTSREPGRSFVDRIKAMEGRDGILSITIAHGFTGGGRVRRGHEGARLCRQDDRDKAAAPRRAPRRARSSPGARAAAGRGISSRKRRSRRRLPFPASRSFSPIAGTIRAAALPATPRSWSRRC